ncbi:E3 ubiquitin-protein ligase TRIM71-like [Mya arenaria]|uniref:E3 ubiquitin-protein ligase TRIM71-like n=1 Tax=Mya arenaria TaxID=6604 RepID=UPI0022E860DD|nr:E3 ubiquitin-protein ligase TRIM71-like [Mya arenaria]XP_052817707.1 E3 ubiquitin-protein ligase TRIM71-like [Mya arenaria]
MEVSGKRGDPDLDKGSADATVYCQPCEEGGKRAVARGYCQTCEEYMCDPCIEAHKRFKVSRNHIVLSKDKMHSFYPSTKQSDIGETDYCKTHPKEMIKFYCPTHGDLGCGDCVLLDHRSCKVDYIANVAKDFIIGNEIRELEPSIKRAEDLLSGSISNVNELLDEVENQSKDEIARLRKFRAEINAYLDRREKELLDNIKKVKTDNQNVLPAFKSDCESAKSGLEAMRAELSSGDISVNQRYVAARRAEKDLRNILDKKEQTTGLIKARKYRFTKDPDTERLLGSNMGPGTLDVAGEFKDIPVPDLSTVTWKMGADINVKATQDQTCCITGSAVLTSDLLLLADWNNQNVKLVNVPARTVTSCLQLPGSPWDVCVLHDGQTAVTLPHNSVIQLVSTKQGQLSCGKEITVSPECYGITSYSNRLYVSYVSNPRVEVMTFDGHIISTFQTDDGRHLFQASYYLTVSASIPPTLYVSDLTAHTVLQLSMDGKVLRENRDEQLVRPRSVVEVGPGQMVVCGLDSHNVMLLTEMDGKMTEILEQEDGLTNPYSVSFCPHTRAIVIAMYNSDSLKIFNAN